MLGSKPSNSARKGALPPTARPIPRPGHPHLIPKAKIEPAINGSLAIQSASRVRAGTRSIDLRAWKPFPVTASDKGAGRSHRPNAGHVIPEVTVENSWPCMTDGPSGRDDLRKAGAISSRSRRACGYVRDKRLTTAR